jgi:P27 family predicted phage terminase small subunit
MRGPTGPKPMPKHLKLVTGNRAKRSLNYEEPQPERLIPDPPDILSEEALAEWHRIVPRLKSAGMMSVVDGASLAAYCQSYGRWVQAERVIQELGEQDPFMFKGLITRAWANNPLIALANKSMADMVRYASEFGMTPCSRARVRLNLDATNDPTDHFFSS